MKVPPIKIMCICLGLRSLISPKLLQISQLLFLDFVDSLGKSRIIHLEHSICGIN